MNAKELAEIEKCLVEALERAHALEAQPDDAAPDLPSGPSVSVDRGAEPDHPLCACGEPSRFSCDWSFMGGGVCTKRLCGEHAFTCWSNRNFYRPRCNTRIEYHAGNVRLNENGAIGYVQCDCGQEVIVAETAAR